MKIARVIGLALTAVAAPAAVMSVWSIVEANRERAEVERLATLADASTTWTSGAVALAFERSVTQVALALDDPAPAAFRDLIAEQRALSNARLDDAIEQIAGSDGIEGARSFIAAAEATRSTIDGLRADVDAAIASPRAARDAERAYALPYDIKATILELVALTSRVHVPNEITSQEVNRPGSLGDHFL